MRSGITAVFAMRRGLQVSQVQWSRSLTLIRNTHITFKMMTLKHIVVQQQHVARPQLIHGVLQGNPSRSSRSLEVPAAAGTPPAPWCSVTPYLATPGKSDAETDSKPQAGTDAFVPAALIPNVERLLQVSV